MKKQEDDAVLFTKHKADPFVLRVQCNTKVLSTCIFPASARSGNVTLTELPGLWSERVPGALRPCPGVVRGFQQWALFSSLPWSSWSLSTPPRPYCLFAFMSFTSLSPALSAPPKCESRIQATAPGLLVGTWTPHALGKSCLFLSPEPTPLLCFWSWQMLLCRPVAFLSGRSLFLLISQFIPHSPHLHSVMVAVVRASPSICLYYISLCLLYPFIPACALCCGHTNLWKQIRSIMLFI